EDVIYASLACDNLSKIHSEAGNLDSSVFFSKKSLALAEKFHNKEMMSSALGHLAVLYGEMKKYKESKDLFLRSIKMNEEIGDLQGLANRLANFADLQIALKDLAG